MEDVTDAEKADLERAQSFLQSMAGVEPERLGNVKVVLEMTTVQHAKALIRLLREREQLRSDGIRDSELCEAFDQIIEGWNHYAAYLHPELGGK